MLWVIKNCCLHALQKRRPSLWLLSWFWLVLLLSLCRSKHPIPHLQIRLRRISFPSMANSGLCLSNLALHFVCDQGKTSLDYVTWSHSQAGLCPKYVESVGSNLPPHIQGLLNWTPLWRNSPLARGHPRHARVSGFCSNKQHKVSCIIWPSPWPQTQNYQTPW